jgi:hypothetical protein
MSVVSDMYRLLEARAVRIPKSRIKKLARDLEAKLLRKLKDSSKPLGQSGDAIVQMRFAFKNVAGERVNPYVMLVPVTTSSEYYVHELGAGIGKVAQVPDDVIIIHINGSIPQSRLKGGAESGMVSSQLYRVLIHELTHAAEYGRIHPKQRKKKTYLGGVGSRVPSDQEMAKAGTLKTYYNDPTEVRAFTQEIVDQLHVSIEKWDQLSGLLGGPTKAVRTVLNNSDTWLMIKDHLTPRNRRYVMKAVATAIRDR